MAARRVTIYLAQPIVDAFDIDNDAGETLSGRIAIVAERYRDMIAAHCPELSRNEWFALCDVANGMFFGIGAATSAPRMLWAEFDDACRTDSVDEKWEIDGPALVEKLREMTTAEIFAVAEVTRRFWVRGAGRTGDEALNLALDIAGPKAAAAAGLPPVGESARQPPVGESA